MRSKPLNPAFARLSSSKAPLRGEGKDGGGSEISLVDDAQTGQCQKGVHVVDEP